MCNQGIVCQLKTKCTNIIIIYTQRQICRMLTRTAMHKLAYVCMLRTRHIRTRRRIILRRRHYNLVFIGTDLAQCVLNYKLFSKRLMDGIFCFNKAGFECVCLHTPNMRLTYTTPAYRQVVCADHFGFCFGQNNILNIFVFRQC